MITIDAFKDRRMRLSQVYITAWVLERLLLSALSATSVAVDVYEVPVAIFPFK